MAIGYLKTLTKRQENLLGFIVREYIRTAKPVPSAVVTKKAKIKVSPATIRNEMYELEEMGFLLQLHTSGGRVPTDLAYRFYVNTLLADPDKINLDRSDKRKISEALKKADQDPRALNKAIANTVSDLSGNLVIAGIAEEAEFFKRGLVTLFRNPEFKEIENAFQIASFFEGFDLMFQLVEREFFRTLGSPSGLPIQILIGKENPFKQISAETIMCTKYLLPDDVIGSLTLIGPKRMDYEKNIGLLHYTTQQLQKINQ